MGMELSDLIERIGIAVQNANSAIEQVAVAAYLGQSYDRVNDAGQDKYTPVSFQVSVPTAAGEKKVNVPVTALMHHTSLRLEQVDVNLKFQIEEDSGDRVMVSVKSPKHPEASTLNELSLQFKSAPPAEGMARIDHHHVQAL